MSVISNTVVYFSSRGSGGGGGRDSLLRRDCREENHWNCNPGVPSGVNQHLRKLVKVPSKSRIDSIENFLALDSFKFLEEIRRGDTL